MNIISTFNFNSLIKSVLFNDWVYPAKAKLNKLTMKTKSMNILNTYQIHYIIVSEHCL
jgi:hypothetical protein